MSVPALQQPLAGSSVLLGRARLCASKPIKRKALGVRHREHADLLQMDLEGNGIREALNEGPAYRSRCVLDVWPERVRVRSLCDSDKRLRHPRDELVTQAQSLLVVPDCRGTELGACFRMKFDPHAAA